MANLTTDRNTPRREGELLSLPVASATTIFAGALVAIELFGATKGYALPGGSYESRQTVGVAQERVVNAGANGAVSVKVAPGVFRFDNAAGDLVTLADIGERCWAVDDHTVSRTSGGAQTRPFAGRVVDVDADGVWVAVGDAGELVMNASADVSSIAAQTSVDLNVVFPGVNTNDELQVSPPSNLPAGLAVMAWVSAADTVKLRLLNITAGAIDPPSGLYRISVRK